MIPGAHDSRSDPSVREWPGGTRLWAALIPAMTIPFGAALVYFVWLPDQPLGRWIYGATKVFTLVWPLIALRLLLREPWPRPALPNNLGPSLRAGFISGLFIVALMALLWQTPVRQMLEASASRIRAKAEGLGFLNYYWPFALFLSLGHSLLEEYYWRWFVFGKLREGVKEAAAHGWAGLAFAAHHIVVTTQFFPLGWGLILGGLVGVGGVIWSWLYARQGNLLGIWLSHLIVDLGIMAIGHKLLFGTFL